MKPITSKTTGEVCYTWTEYLHSEHWRQTVERFKKSKQKQTCNVCQTHKNTNVYHRSYKSLGEENLHHLEVLCIVHYKEVKEYLVLNKSSKINRWTVTEIIQKKYEKTKSEKNFHKVKSEIPYGGMDNFTA